MKFEDKDQRLKLTSKYLISICFLALVIRLLIVLFSPFPEAEFEDHAEYNNIAWNLLQGHGYSIETESHNKTARRGPTYPLFLAAIYSVFGQNYTAVYVIQAILSTFTCLIIYLLGKKSLDDDRVGLIAALGAALYPAFWEFNRQLMTETLFTFLLAMILLLWIKTIKENSARWYPLIGIFIGIGSLCRTTLATLPVFILLGLLLLYQDKKRAFINGVTVFLATCLVIAPWAARNYFVFHRFIPITAIMGQDLIGTITPHEGIDWKQRAGDKFMPKLKEIMDKENKSLNDAAIELTVNEIKEDPFLYFRLLPGKFFWFWRTYSYSEMFGVKGPSWEYIENKDYVPVFLKLVLLILNTLPLLFGILGLFFIRDKWRTVFPLLLIIVYFSVVHTLIHPGSGPRYHAPIMSAVFVFASLGIIKIIGLVRSLGESV